MLAPPQPSRAIYRPAAQQCRMMMLRGCYDHMIWWCLTYEHMMMICQLHISVIWWWYNGCMLMLIWWSNDISGVLQKWYQQIKAKVIAQWWMTMTMTSVCVLVISSKCSDWYINNNICLFFFSRIQGHLSLASINCRTHVVHPSQWFSTQMFWCYQIGWSTKIPGTRAWDFLVP